MCLGIPGLVVEIVDAEAHLARVDVSGVQRIVSVQLLAQEGVAVDDWVLVHVGFALAKIDESEAALTLAQLAAMEADYQAELAAFSSTQVGLRDGLQGDRWDDRRDGR
jgi:hydrogenase expression/formation protein HypC